MLLNDIERQLNAFILLIHNRSPLYTQSRIGELASMIPGYASLSYLLITFNPDKNGLVLAKVSYLSKTNVTRHILRHD